MTAPLIAVVGRPNVGKSTLFNRLVGGRPALVHDTPGLTRDRRYGACDYFGTELRIVDTGGLDPDAERDVIGAGIHRQALHAIGEADALLLVVDGYAGVTAVDHELAKRLRATGKPVFLAVNKIDHAVRDGLVHDFHELGLGPPYPISAAHGRGVDPLLEAITEATRPAPEEQARDLLAVLDESIAANEDEDDGDAAREGGDDDEGEASDEDDDGTNAADVADIEDEDEAAAAESSEADDDAEAANEASDEAATAAARAEARAVAAAEARAAAQPLRVAFVGRPNAGKSSLTNRLLGEERSLVHHEAGTTTDPVDTPFSLGGRDYILVDTAGIRRKAKIDVDIEKIAVSMAIGQIDRADVVVLVIDAAIGPAEQDARIAGMVEEAGRALVIALNKSDTLTGEARKAQLRELTADTFHFMPWAQTVLLSAQRGDGVDKLLDRVDHAAREHRKRIPTAQLNRFFAEVVQEKPPPLHHGRAVRVHYLTQATTRPPTFVLWANTAEGLAPSYRRFLMNRLRDRYGFRGTPIRIAVKARQDRHKRAADDE